MTAIPEATAFERAVAVSAAGAGRFTAEVDEGWGAPTGPNGGYLAAICVRAIQAASDPAGERRLRSLTCHFLRSPRVGPIALTVKVLRAGRRLTNVRATAEQDGKVVLTALAALAVPGLESPLTRAPVPPRAPGPPSRASAPVGVADYSPDGKCWLATDPAQVPSIVARTLLAPLFGAAPFSGTPVTTDGPIQTGGWLTLREPQRIDAALAVLLCDVWWPPVFASLSEPAIAPTIDLTVHIRGDLPLGGLNDQPVLAQYETATIAGGMLEEDGRLFLSDGTLLAQSRQLALLAAAGG